MQGGSQQSRGGAALQKLQEIHSAHGPQEDERDAQIAEIEARVISDLLKFSQ